MGQAQTKIKNKRKHKFESKEEYFIQNGRLLLEKQLSLSQGKEIVGQVKILSQEEIMNATNNYDPNLIVAKSDIVNYYKGKIDNMVVFIKAPQERDPNPKLIHLFSTELSVLTVICHDNMSKLYGCCLETYIPMIAYQHKSGKTLHQYLHGGLAIENPMKWSSQLTVAANIGYALSYMHNALSKPLVHRNVKSPFILIQESSFQAMLASVAYSVSITPGKKNQRWPVHGTPGYIDPEYVETGEVTDKCDVYSFGVVMIELLTGLDPIEMARIGKNLVDEFVSRAEIKDMINKRVLEEGDKSEIQRFARLALQYVAGKGEERPTMINVVEELWKIQKLDKKTMNREIYMYD